MFEVRKKASKYNCFSEVLSEAFEWFSFKFMKITLRFIIQNRFILIDIKVKAEPESILIISHIYINLKTFLITIDMNLYQTQSIIFIALL